VALEFVYLSMLHFNVFLSSLVPRFHAPLERERERERERDERERERERERKICAEREREQTDSYSKPDHSQQQDNERQSRHTLPVVQICTITMSVRNLPKNS
jgi:hypothetical protein